MKPCPKCNSSDVWDDNSAQGCNRCNFIQTFSFNDFVLIDKPMSESEKRQKEEDDYEEYMTEY